MQAAFKGPEISIHALLAESDGPRCKGPWACFPFLSTLSLRRATIRPHQRHFAADISIHALLAESDEAEDGYKDTVTEFLSTLSLRRATVEEVSGDTWTRDFYPRSPCGERPRLATRSRHYPMDFYPRSPCGERRQWRRSVKLFRQFLSTLSLRRATVTVLGIQHRVGISIHALLAESDGQYCESTERAFISIHALLAESDTRHGSGRPDRDISIHALLAESDL